MACYKRILYELHNQIPEKMLHLNFNDKFYFIALGNDIVSKQIGVINKKTNLVELKIVISSHYPFQPPSVFVTNDNDNASHNHVLSYSTVIPLTIASPPTIKYNKWCVSILHNNYDKKCAINSMSNIFLAWAFCIIKRPLLFRYWYGNIPNINNCLFCQSIMSSNNWCSHVMMIDILAEYVTRRDFKINCAPLMQRWISPIFNNNIWVIPDDIILEIVKRVT